MEKSDETAEKEAWGTWEELLLAFAVNRYGSKSWDSVAGEIQKRSSKMTPFLTPCNCKQKFHDLKRRYTHELARHQNDAVGDDKTEIETIPWLDELRKLRITELKRELEHYDLSIVSLQSKVKRLKEEKDESLGASENGGEDQLDPEEREVYTEPEKLSPKSVVCKLIITDELDRDNQSVAQSNSTDSKCENVETGEVKVDNDPELVRTADENRQPAPGSEKPVREESCNGSSNSIAKEMVKATSVKVEQEGGASESPELWESVAESKGSAEKESSDVQSSASQLKKEESDRLHCGSSGSDERETEDQSPALKGTFVKSQPLVDFLEILWSHKLGSVFERLLESQETSKYRNLIRQHIDLKSVKRNVEEGWYLDCKHKFFRDLLLLANNAMVFFGKKSSEFIAATELRQLISKDMAQRNAKADLSAGKQTSLSRLSLQSNQVQERPSDSLLLKPQIAGIITVCRKRSSIAAKGSASSSGSDRKREQTAALAEDKPAVEFKQTSKSSAIAENNRITKKRTRDGSASSSRSSKKNSKTHANTDYDKNFVAITNQNEGTVASPTEHSQPKSEKNTTITAEVKKRSAANFLDRLKRTSSPNSGSFLDTSKSSMLSSVEKDKGIPEQKRSDSIKGDQKEDKVTKRSTRGRQPNEESSPTKRRLGRPPKRAAAPSSVIAESRKRAIGDAAAEASKHPKKKSRK